MDPVTLQPLAAIMCTNCTELLGCSGDCVVIINRLPRPWVSMASSLALLLPRPLARRAQACAPPTTSRLGTFEDGCDVTDLARVARARASAIAGSIHSM